MRTVGPQETAPFAPGSSSSRKAAQRIAYKLPSIRRRVFDYIVSHPGMNDHEIRDGLHLNSNTARPRRIELEEAGLIEWTGETKPGPLGASSQTWRATGRPYPVTWPLPIGGAPAKTKSGETRIRRAMTRAFPSQSKDLRELLEQYIKNILVGKKTTRIEAKITSALKPKEVAALLRYIAK